MKHYLDNLTEIEEPNPKKFKSGNKNKSYNILAVTTGCESDFTLSPPDLVTLSQLGITILNDYSATEPINTLIAPRIMRTEKFLKCLSQVNQIVHPSYITSILKGEEVNVSDYTLEKVLGEKEVNQELGLPAESDGLSKILTSPTKGKVFNGMQINLSSNLNGGAEVITKILQAHGCEEIKVIKSVTAASIKTFIGEKEYLVFIAHKVKDSKAIINFKKLRPQGVVLDWDWCVKSIFHMQQQSFEKFML